MHPIVIVLIPIVLVIAVNKPDAFRVERSIRIEAPPERVYGLIADLKQMKAWNPFERKDPALVGEFGTTTSGVGASYGWAGEKVGAGRMTITEAVPASRVTMRLDFIKPFAATNTAEYTLTPDGSGTRVTWAMHGPAPFVSKLMQVFVSMDKMIGGDFEAGLANLKTLAEARS